MDERDDSAGRAGQNAKNVKNTNAVKQPLKNGDPSAYKTVTTQDFKTHFSRYVREMAEGRYPGVKVTSYGRMVGVFVSAHPFWRTE